MLKIGVVGFTGKVNRIVIEEIEKNLNCTLSGILVRDKKLHNNINNLYDDVKELAKVSDAIIDFSNPDLTMSLASELINSKILLVSGTTGFTKEQFQKLQDCAKYLPIIWSPNMSIGINMLQLLLKSVAPKLADSFDSAIIDIHRRDKKDSPSGTALMLADAIEDNSANKVQVSSLRMGDVLGEHDVIFASASEELTFTHKVLNRNIFAIGAIKACLWGRDKEPGLYSMQDVLK